MLAQENGDASKKDGEASKKREYEMSERMEARREEEVSMQSRILPAVAVAAVALVLATTSRAGPNRQDALASGDYVGTQTCLECHDDQ